jgi:hypothetical protein
VKRSPPSASTARARGHGVAAPLSRHLEGWQAGVVALAVAGLGLLLAVPRSVPPTELPLPMVPPASLESAQAREAARARHLVERTRTSGPGAAYDLRVAGDLLRQIGRADHDKDREQVGVLRDKLGGTLATIRHTASLGDEALVELRAFQEQTFRTELARWEVTGEVSNELIEVAGDFLPLAERSGWVEAPHRLLPDDAVRGALFRKRFGELTGLRDGVFALTVDEQRHLLGFFLLHPPPGGAGPPISDAGLRQRATAQWLLRKVSELAAIDSSYPAAFARGVLLYQAGDPAGSALAFRAHLASHPDGPFTLRARNHLRAAEARLEIVSD